ncbi:aspartate kinase, partial [bacterium]|nr:aspartate kinase [bacterium]
MYEVHKFGGASIGSFERIKNTIDIIKSFGSDSKIIIFSAMGKVTNMLEEIIISSYKGEIYFNQFEKLKNYHYGLVDKFYLQECDLFSEINLLFEELKKTLKNRSDNYQLYYDQNVVYGELISTKIMSVLLNLENFDNQLIDARDIIMTDDNYCNANI